MRTPCCQSLRSNRLVVSEYEVPKVWFPKSVKFFLKHPVYIVIFWHYLSVLCMVLYTVPAQYIAYTRIVA